MKIQLSLRHLIGTASPTKELGSDLGWDEPVFFPDSSNLAVARYNEVDRLLEIQFRNGRTYRYRSVPPDVFQNLQTATSAGRYFARVIRGRYPTSRV